MSLNEESFAGPVAAVDDDGYVWRGMQFPRVTRILQTAPGNHLVAWFAKQAALQTAHWLLMAGLWEPEIAGIEDALRAAQTMADSPEKDEEVARLRRLHKVALEMTQFVDGKAMRIVKPDEAMRQIADWADNMREGYRYRDHKARVGSVVHHAAYDHAIGVRVPESGLVEYLSGLAKKTVERPEYSDFVRRTTEYGKTMEDAVYDLAVSAAPYVGNVVRWIEDFQPEWEAVGQEAMVVSEEVGYAGTMDFIARFPRSRWERQRAWHWGAQEHARLTGDFKTSNSLSVQVGFQLAAYTRADYIALRSDDSVHEIGDVDGMVAVHVRKQEKCLMKVFDTQESIDRLFDGFCGLVEYFRCLHDMPRSARSRARSAAPKPKRTVTREVPF